MQKNSKGFAHLPLVILLVFCVLVIGIAGWKVASLNNAGDDKKSTEAAVNTSQTPLEKDCLSQLHDKDFCKFASVLVQTEKLAYKATVNSVSSGTSSVITWQNDGHGNSATTTVSAGKEIEATISLNNSTYVKDESSGSWTKYKTNDPTSPKETSPDNYVKIDSTDLTEKNTLSYKALGKEPCGSLSCFKYQVFDKTQPANTQIVWFDTKDYRMQRININNGKDTANVTLSYQSVAIKEPSPVHDFSGVNTPTNTPQPDDNQ